MGSSSSRSVCRHSANNKDSDPFFVNNWVCSAELLEFLGKTDKEFLSDSDFDKESDSLDPSLTDNLVRLPSAMMERGHHIRRVETNLDSTEEKLARVKRRAKVVREIVAAENIPLLSITTPASSLDSNDTRALKDATPHDFVYLKVLGTGATGTVV
uniref:AlNc14C6G855 protein n=1 Tax=Albugo laibachii Nc14 TaxID=890382 RepID=F0W178_9STRA|nr:AlNc14C6G855 [Albugo laibachii Nc14]|eukprot:CCA14804.1 AlNc14C6G855 [Albugo laibachii Nc14]